MNGSSSSSRNNNNNKWFDDDVDDAPQNGSATNNRNNNDDDEMVPMVPATADVSSISSFPLIMLNGTTASSLLETAALVDVEIQEHNDEETATIATTTTPVVRYGAIPAIVVENELITTTTIRETSSRYNNNYNNYHDNNDSDSSEKPVRRDGFFANLFVLQLCAIGYMGVFIAPEGWEQWRSINITTLAIEIQQSDEVSTEDVQTIKEVWQQTQAYVAVYPQRILTLSILPACLMAFLLSLVITNVIIKRHPHTVVVFSLFGPLLVVAAVLLLALFASQNHGYGFVLLLTPLACMAMYFIATSWRMTPYAATNLAVALEGISSNLGTYLLAFVLSELNCVWFFGWLYVTIGLLSWQEEQCSSSSLSSTNTTITAVLATATTSSSTTHHSIMEDDAFMTDGEDACDRLQGWTFLILLASLYWTSTVIANSLQVTVAGVMATWCFDKRETRGFCSPAVYSSLFRSVTYSFGSICLGSLVQAVVSTVGCILRLAKNQRDDVMNRHQQQRDSGSGLLLCILECLAFLLDELIQYINQWAFVFVGIYGYSYWESGKRVMELFRSRGWTALITNGLVNYVLGFTTLIVGIVNGILSMMMESIITDYYNKHYYYHDNVSLGPESWHQEQQLPHGLTPLQPPPPLSLQFPTSGQQLPLSSPVSYVFGPLPGWRYLAFGVGFVMGMIVCSILMNVLQGAVNTLIVCWADAPTKLEANHPAATQAMSRAWTNVFPESAMFFAATTATPAGSTTATAITT